MLRVPQVYIAVLSAIAEQNTEMALLTQADTIGRMSLLQFINGNLRSVSAVNATDAAFQYNQFINATCACANVPINSTTTVTWLQNGTLLTAFNNSVNGTTDYPTYASRVCTPAFGSGGAGAAALTILLAQHTARLKAAGGRQLCCQSLPHSPLPAPVWHVTVACWCARSDPPAV